MGLTENKRIQHIVNTSAAIAADDFDGRLAYDTTEQAIRIKAGGVAKYASMRGHTHTEYVQKTGDTMTGDLQLPGIRVTDLATSGDPLPVVANTAGDLITQDVSDFRDTINAVSRGGDSLTGPLFTTGGGGQSPAIDVQATSLPARIGWYNPGAAVNSRRWEVSTGWTLANFDKLQVVTVSDDQTTFTPVAIFLRTGSMVLTALAGTGNRVLRASASGEISAVASQYVTREMVIQALPITNAAPGVVTLGPSGSMRSFGFDGVNQIEELFYHIDLQHDYVAGTDVIPHVHWAPSTNGTGDVVFRFDYQWVEGGASWPAPTTVSCPAVAAGGTAWADKRSEVTISGAGKTYGSRLVLRLYRDPTDPNDTYAADAVLSSIGVHYTADPMQVG